MKTYFAILVLVALTNGLSLRGPGGKNPSRELLQPSGVVGQQWQGVYQILQQQLVDLLESQGVSPQQSLVIAEEVIGEQGQVIIKRQIQLQLVQQLVVQGLPPQQAVLLIEQVFGLEENIVPQQVIQQLVQQGNLTQQQAVFVVEKLFSGVYSQQTQQYIRQQLQQYIQQLQLGSVVGRQITPQLQYLIQLVQLLENQGIAPQQAFLIADLIFGQQWQTIEQLVQLLIQQGIPTQEAFLISENVLGGQLGQVIARIYYQSIPLPEKVALKQLLIQQGPALLPLVSYELNQLRAQGVIGQQGVVGSHIPLFGQQRPIFEQRYPVIEQQTPLLRQVPIVRQQYPVFGQVPVIGQQTPVYRQQDPIYGQQYPVYGKQGPVYGQQYPVYGQQYPVYGQQYPVYGGLRSAIWQQIIAQRWASKGRQY